MDNMTDSTKDQQNMQPVSEANQTIEENNFRPETETFYMVISSRVDHILLGEKRRPYADETTYFLNRYGVMQLSLSNRITEMLAERGTAALFKTKEEAIKEMQDFLRRADEAKVKAEAWQKRRRYLHKMFPFYNPYTNEFDDYIRGGIFIDDEIRLQFPNLRIIELTLTEKALD